MRGVSDEDNVREPYRPLTEREREILEHLLTVEAQGVEELLEQVPTCAARGGTAAAPPSI